MPAALPGQGPGAQGVATLFPRLAAAHRSTPRQTKEAGPPQHLTASLSPAPSELSASLGSGPHPATHAPLAVKRDANAMQLCSRNCNSLLK